ncbi:MAG: hypothetical protein J5879_10240 [Clostridia bacterium]|nr:hypothetical protein [Clostridia bacterium]
METGAALPTNEKNRSEKTGSVRKIDGFKVSGVFSSHMVLQRDRRIKIWGFSDAEGSRVSGSFDGEDAETTVKDGRFELVFGPRKASGQPKTMTVRDDRGRQTTFDDILTGDVWVIGGQSNAELNLRFSLPETLPREFDGDSLCRLFMQTQAYPYTHQEFCGCPQPDVICPDWHWRRTDKEASLSFSAIGWFIGTSLSAALGIPVGVINMSAGGACIRELIPEELAEEFGYDYGANVRQCGYYNTLIRPFEGLSFKGMVFFQGESEGGARELAERYDKELARLVEDERARFGFGFPFYNVQLCSYRGEGKQYFPYLETVRMKQYDALYTIPDSELTVSMDLGSPEDWPDFAHSPKKKQLSERITAQILAKEYGIGRLEDAGSPMPAAAEAKDGYVTVKFGRVSDGLCSRGGGREVKGFSFGDLDGLVPAEAVIASADTVTVKIPDGADPSYINYAYESNVTEDNAQLIKSNGLPCPAFRIKTK